MKPYSYRNDDTIPAFDDSSPIVFMDGECVLCSKAARLLSKMDKRQEFKICPTQSPLGQVMFKHYDLSPTDPESWLYLYEGKAYTSMDAVIRVGWKLGGIGIAPVIFRVLPTSWQNRLYGLLARNRYRIWGKTDMCSIPDPELKKRLILQSYNQTVSYSNKNGLVKE